MDKSENTQINSLKTNKYFIPVISMIIYILTALVITIGVKGAFGSSKEETTKIAANPAEEAYFNGKYDVSKNDFTSLQEKEIWPDSMIEIAKIETLQGNYIKSNEILQKAYEKRNKVIDTMSSEVDNIDSRDKELGSNIIFTYFLNGEYKKAMEYGEFYLNVYPDDSKLQQTMFSVYLGSNETDKAKKIVKNYKLDKDSVDDLAAYAQMNLIMGSYEDALKCLNDAWNIDKDSLKIFDALDMVKNKAVLLDTCSKLQEKNKEDGYKALLSKVYSLTENNKDKSLLLIKELKDSDVDSANINLLEYNLKKDDEEERDSIIEDLEDKYDEDTFMGSYVRTIKNFNNKKYDDAFKYAKKCIMLDRSYNGTYYDLIEDIKVAQQKPEGAEPFIMNALYNEKYDYNNLIKNAEYYKDILKDSNKALHYYELASVVDDKNSEIFYNIGLIQIKNQRVDEAVESIKKSISINGNSPKYYRTLGCIYLEKKEKEVSIDYIRKAYSIDENDILTLNDAAYYYAVIDNNIDRAMTNIKSAYKGINDKTTDENKKIITDNYNRIKVAFDSSRRENSTKTQVSELKLIY